MKIDCKLLSDNDFLTADIAINQRNGQSRTANMLLFEFNGNIYAYYNHCMHMQRPLNCQEDAIFDRERQRLRCSMHGFVFDPESGVCLSPVCEGRKLRTIKINEQDGLIGLQDKHAEIIAVYRCGKELL